MAESIGEKFLRDEIQRKGGVCLKLVIMGKRNFPDRTCLTPGGNIFFVEAKDKNKDLRKTQKWFITRVLLPLGFRVYVCRTKEDASEIIRFEMEGAKSSIHLRRLRVNL